MESSTLLSKYIVAELLSKVQIIQYKCRITRGACKVLQRLSSEFQLSGNDEFLRIEDLKSGNLVLRIARFLGVNIRHFLKDSLKEVGVGIPKWTHI